MSGRPAGQIYEANLISAEIVVVDDGRVGEMVRQGDALDAVDAHHLVRARWLQHEAVNCLTWPTNKP